MKSVQVPSSRIPPIRAAVLAEGLYTACAYLQTEGRTLCGIAQARKCDHLGYFAFAKRTPWVLVTEVGPLLPEAHPHPEQDTLRRHGADFQVGQTHMRKIQIYGLAQARIRP